MSRRTAPGRKWNEKHLSEEPAVALLERLGYRHVAREDLEGDRDGQKEPVLRGRLGPALKRLNPWLSDDNVHQAVRAVTSVPATGLIEANRDLYTTLTMGKSFEQDRGEGRKSYDVRYIDFERPRDNDLVVTRQYRVKGAQKTIIPDIVVFVNGIPLAVVECKSPTVGDLWRGQAIAQLQGYQDAGAGAPRLFETVQILVSTCMLDALYGTVGTPVPFYAQWKETLPRAAKSLIRELGRSPSVQDELIYGLLLPENLLDIVRSFIAFETDPSSHKLIKKVCGYPQRRAVNAALARVAGAKAPSARGGVVWHTQGSGKSLTMLWLALKLRRDPLQQNPMIVIVTDRVDLDDQIAGTFARCGFPNPVAATSAAHLHDLLSGPTGVTVTTTVQKFRDLMTEMKDTPKELNPAANIFVFVDEAHRTQYGVFAANMRASLPNACFFGFSGTPIDRKDRSTLRTFGPYIDTYTLQQAVEDGATLPIFYESRLPKVYIVGASLDRVFDRIFAEQTPAEREAIKEKYATESAIAAAPRRVETICLDIIEHYTKFIQPNRFKAQVVAVSREAAVAYAEKLVELKAPPTAIIISGKKGDVPSIAEHVMTEEKRKLTIARFLDRDDPLAILVVCDMLLTGFDAPVEQVMYLDSPLREHTLLQAIARVNRRADLKDYGLVVDYWGVSARLQEALDIFSPTDVKGVMTPKSDEMPRLQGRHAALMRVFLGVAKKDDFEKCLAVLRPEDVRAEFDVAFRRFSKSLDMLLPDPRALSYVDDLRWANKLRKAAAALYRDPALDVSEHGAKVKRLIDDAVAADGMQILVEKVSLFSNKLDEKLAALKSDDAKASEMEHTILDEIHVRLDEDPAFYTSLRDKLTRIIEDRKAQRIDEAKQLTLLDGLVKEARGRGKQAERLGLSPTAYAIYGILAEGKPLTIAEPRGPAYEANRELAALIEEAVDRNAQIVDWAQKEDVIREMRRQIKRQLGAAGMAVGQVDTLAKAIVELAKVRKGR